MSNNNNHPKRGSHITVEPIRKVKDIRAIQQLLASRPRDLAMFLVGINTNLRASDLVRLTVGQVRLVRPMHDVLIYEKKTGKERRLTLNQACVDAIQALLATEDMRHAGDGELLFQGKRGDGPMTTSYINRLVKRWCAAINLPGNFGSHTLRKTWGYHQRVRFGAGLPELMVAFNHSKQSVTLRYLGIQPDEVKSLYANVIK